MLQTSLCRRCHPLLLLNADLFKLNNFKNAHNSLEVLNFPHLEVVVLDLRVDIES